MVYSFNTDEPTGMDLSHNIYSIDVYNEVGCYVAVAMHASGYQTLVSFKDRVRMYNIVMDKLKYYKETIVKSCKDLKFSNGCQFWAGTKEIYYTLFNTHIDR